MDTGCRSCGSRFSLLAVENGGTCRARLIKI